MSVFLAEGIFLCMSYCWKLCILLLLIPIAWPLHIVICVSSLDTVVYSQAADMTSCLHLASRYTVLTCATQNTVAKEEGKIWLRLLNQCRYMWTKLKYWMKPAWSPTHGAKIASRKNSNHQTFAVWTILVLLQLNHYYNFITMVYYNFITMCCYNFSKCVSASLQSELAHSYAHSGNEKCVFVVLGDDAAPPQHVPLSWTIHNLVPKKRAPAHCVWKGPLKRDPSLCTAHPLTTERGPRGHQAPAIGKKKKHTNHICIWFDYPSWLIHGPASFCSGAV